MRIKALFIGCALLLAGSHASALVEMTGIADITTGARHACALTQSGGVKCWGGNDSGELGDGSRTKRSIAAFVSGLSIGAIAVSAGGIDTSDTGTPATGHTCAVTSAGGVKCWGANDTGQLGDGSTTSSPIPIDVSGLGSGVVAVSAGGKHSCALMSAGGVKCWGSNTAGELGDGSTTQRLTPVDVAGLPTAVAEISATHLHTCALTATGAMLCWGANESGQLGNGTFVGSLTPVAVSSLESEVAVIGTARGAAPGVDVSTKSGGNSCAVTTSGAAKCWGANYTYQLGDGTRLPHSTPFEVSGLGSGTAAVAPGSWSSCGFGLADRSARSHACALTSVGGVKCWGANTYDELGVARQRSSCGASEDFYPLPRDIPTITSGQVGIGAGVAYNCALGGDTKVRCWGLNGSGQLGAGESYALSPGSGHPFRRGTPAPVMQNETERAPQTITFGAAPTIPVGGTGTVTATASSGLAVVFTSLTPSVCSVSGSTVSGLQNAMCTIAANQSGSATFDPAPQATQEFLIGNKVAQTITFGPAPTIVVGSTGKVSATASSGLAVSFTSNSPSICSVSGDVVTGLAAGTCTIAASQSGNAMYQAAPQKTQNITVTSSSSSVADLSVSQTQAPDPASAGKDVMYTMTVGNAGPGAAESVTLQDVLPSGVAYVWASSACANAAGTVTCNLGTLANGASMQVKIVVRPSSAGSMTHTVTVSSSTAESNHTNNTASTMTTVNSTPAGTAVVRYRLYSDGTKEHLFTTDLNEYNVLGASGAWTQEGSAGQVLNNPGSFNGVEAVPYYRLYNSSSTWHHWTTDANEYYTLIEFPDWHGEGVDGYILPAMTAGATQLYRLLYPFVPGLHHWTIDANEYATLTDSDHGWIGEGGAGFVIQ